MERDEIYLVDLWKTLCREWLWFVAVLVLVLAATYAFAHLARRQWEATAWILIGQVGQTPPGQDPKIEPLLRVIERLQTMEFQHDVTQALGLADDSREARLYRKSMRLDPMPYAGPMVRLSVRGDSPQQARDLANATVAHLRAVHHGMEAVPLKLARARLGEIENELGDALAERDRLLQVVNKGDADGKAASLASVLLSSKGEDIRNLQMQRTDLQTRLSANYTYETSEPWPAYVPDHQAFPNPALTWGLGLLAGLGLGAFASVARNAARRGA